MRDFQKDDDNGDPNNNKKDEQEREEIYRRIRPVCVEEAFGGNLGGHKASGR